MFGRSRGSRQTVKMSRATVRKRLAAVLRRIRKLYVFPATRPLVSIWEVSDRALGELRYSDRGAMWASVDQYR